MAGDHALDAALSLARMPTIGDTLRLRAVPDDILVVIRIAAGCAESCSDAQKATGLDVQYLRDACTLYLQQVLFSVGGDSYRVLGVARTASKQQMREHMRWLLKWLHPDRNQNEWESAFAVRVISAWGQASRRGPEAPSGVAEQSRLAVRPTRRARPAQRWIALPLQDKLKRSHRRNRKLVFGAVVGLLSLGFVIAPVVWDLPELAAAIRDGFWPSYDRE